MAIKSLHQFFYYQNKYLNSMKCQEINMGKRKWMPAFKKTTNKDKFIVSRY
jgi:hypothetical protein